eukprot:NODE_42_length_29671_cov_0.584810.p19 type:complete len:130 gc:universal NODE_42_length_29671_cov_0.584810:7322-7711(+)
MTQLTVQKMMSTLYLILFHCFLNLLLELVPQNRVNASLDSTFALSILSSLPRIISLFKSNTSASQYISTNLFALLATATFEGAHTTIGPSLKGWRTALNIITQVENVFPVPGGPWTKVKSEALLIPYMT